MCNQTIMNWLNLIVLVATLITIICYTVITNKLHLVSTNQLAELLKQRRLSIMPTLLPSLKRNGKIEEFILRNIGNGIALNIQIHDVDYAPKVENTYYKFREIPMLRQEESASVFYQSYLTGVLEHDVDLAPFSEHASSPVVIRITFSDLAGDKYEQLYQMGKEPDKNISIRLIK
jgi:hypothetical protein